MLLGLQSAPVCNNLSTTPGNHWHSFLSSCLSGTLVNLQCNSGLPSHLGRLFIQNLHRSQTSHSCFHTQERETSTHSTESTIIYIAIHHRYRLHRRFQECSCWCTVTYWSLILAHKLWRFGALTKCRPCGKIASYGQKLAFHVTFRFIFIANRMIFTHARRFN